MDLCSSSLKLMFIAFFDCIYIKSSQQTMPLIASPINFEFAWELKGKGMKRKEEERQREGR